MEGDEAVVGPVARILSYNAERNVPVKLQRKVDAIAMRYQRWREMPNGSREAAFPAALMFAALEFCIQHDCLGKKVAGEMRGRIARLCSDDISSPDPSGDPLKTLLGCFDKAAAGTMTMTELQDHFNFDDWLCPLQAVAHRLGQALEGGFADGPVSSSGYFDRRAMHGLADLLGVHLCVHDLCTGTGSALAIRLGKECDPPFPPCVTLILHANQFDILYPDLA